jgi:hypothetical protein
MSHSQRPSWAASIATASCASLNRAFDSACARSRMTAASDMIGIHATVKKVWIERAFSSAELATNGPRPRTAPQIATSAQVRIETLAPSGPKRTAASTSSGTGA